MQWKYRCQPTFCNTECSGGTLSCSYTVTSKTCVSSCITGWSTKDGQRRCGGGTTTVFVGIGSDGCYGTTNISLKGHSTLNKDNLHPNRTIYIQQGYSTVHYNSQFYFSNNNHHRISQTIISYTKTLNYSSTTNYNYRYLLPVTLSVVVGLCPVPTLLEAKHV